MSTHSPEINALLANMGVSSRSRLSGGAATHAAETHNPTLPLSEVSAVLNDGTSHSSSLLGVRTVFEDANGGDSHMSDAVTLFPSTQPHSGSQPKQYSIFCMPTTVEGLMGLCRSKIGRSRTFCLVRGCTTNHQGGLVAVKPGDLVISKASARIAFENPRISSKLLDDSLIAEWITCQETLTSWTNKFGQAKEVAEFGQLVDLRAFEAKIEEEKRAATFKTPRVKRGTLASKATPLGLGISPYTKTVRGHESFDNFESDSTQEKMVDLLVKLDGALEEISAYTVMLGQDVEKLSNTSANNAKMLESKLHVASRLVGTRAEDLASELDSPTLWGALSSINLKIEEVRAEANRYVNSSHNKAAPLLEVRLGKVESDISKMDSDLLQTVTHFSTAIRSLKDQVEETPHQKHDAAQNHLDSSIIGDVQERLTALSNNIEVLKTNRKASSVKFAGLGFDSPDKAHAWLEKHMMGQEAGLVVDPHTVFEHIYADGSNEDFFKNFERVHKLQISTLQQGYAMMSFQRSVPKFFSGNTNRVVKDYTSHFDRILSWSDWDYPATGHRDTLKIALKAFDKSHKEVIASELSDKLSSPANAIASMALSESISIIEAWINFIDEYMKSLLLAKFDEQKAFHVTTMLARRLIEAIFVPRQGILKTFKAGNMDQISKVVFWSTLRSLDIAVEIKTVGFANHPMVAGELVRFLTVNSGVEVSERLESRVISLEAEVHKLTDDLKQAKRDIQSANKSAQTASNKADTAQKGLDTLMARVSKLE